MNELLLLTKISSVWLGGSVVGYYGFRRMERVVSGWTAGKRRTAIVMSVLVGPLGYVFLLQGLAELWTTFMHPRIQDFFNDDREARW